MITLYLILFCMAKDPVLDDERYCFTNQNSIFCKTKSELLKETPRVLKQNSVGFETKP
jgi:hypothetical protein